jgi:hypothetical protein
MEITPGSKLPVKLFYNWAHIRSTEQKDTSPLVKCILADPFFNTCVQSEPGESSLFHIVANYWLIPQVNAKDSKLPQSQHIPQQYTKWMSAVAGGQPFQDDSLYTLFTRVGVPYLDLNGEAHYHHFVDIKSVDAVADSSVVQQIEWRGLPHLFPMLCDQEPLKSNLMKHRGLYIAQPFFLNLLRIMPFLFWLAQAYTQSIQLTTPIQIKDSFEIDGKFAFGCLFEHSIKGYKDSATAQGLYDLVLLVCQVLTHGTTVGHSQRSSFVNRMFQIIAEKKHILLNDITEFLICGDFGHGLTSLDANELVKQTKGMGKRFHQSPWLTISAGTIDHVVLSDNGVALFKTEFLQKLEAFDQLHDFLTSPAKADECSIM